MTELRTHPTDETLRDFLLGKLPDADSPELETHLADCPDCQARTADGCAADTFVDLLTSARTRMAARASWHCAAAGISTASEKSALTLCKSPAKPSLPKLYPRLTAIDLDLPKLSTSGFTGTVMKETHHA